MQTRSFSGLLALFLVGPAFASSSLCQDALWPYEVQGPGDASPLAGETVTVRGTVTFTDARRDGLRGFFIQGPTDNNPQTSEALFIYAPGHTPTRLDEVVVTGEVKEFHGLTELTSVQAVAACGRAALPDPVPLTTPAEPLENMRVALPASQIVDNYRLLDVGELVISDGEFSWTLEDGSNERNLDALPWGLPQEPKQVATGQQLGPITGVLTWRWNRWVVLPDRTPTLTNSGDWTHRAADDSRLRLVSFNAENLFNGNQDGFSDSRGARSQQEWRQQRRKVAQGILALDGDVVLLQEVEHDRGQPPEVLPEMVNKLNAMGSRTYAAVAPAVRPGDDAITNAVLYDTDRVSPDGELTRIASEPRPALVQAFTRLDTGERFHTINVHMKSRGRGCRDICAGDRADELQAILTWLAEHQTDESWILAGDFNTLTGEPLWEPLRQADWTRAEVTKPTYWFRGQPQQIDHIWHRNLDASHEAWVQSGYAEMPPMPFTHPLYDTETPWGASDHNPVLIEW